MAVNGLKCRPLNPEVFQIICQVFLVFPSLFFFFIIAKRLKLNPSASFEKVTPMSLVDKRSYKKAVQL